MEYVIYPLLSKTHNIVASFSQGNLELDIPDHTELSLNTIFHLIHNLQNALTFLPHSIQDIKHNKVNRLYYNPSLNEIELGGIVRSLQIIPNLVTLHNFKYVLVRMIGRNSNIKYASFIGEWIINNLYFTTYVLYEAEMFVIPRGK